jgi:hypothetical protein
MMHSVQFNQNLMKTKCQAANWQMTMEEMSKDDELKGEGGMGGFMGQMHDHMGMGGMGGDVCMSIEHQLAEAAEDGWYEENPSSYDVGYGTEYCMEEALGLLPWEPQDGPGGDSYGGDMYSGGMYYKHKRAMSKEKRELYSEGCATNYAGVCMGLKKMVESVSEVSSENDQGYDASYYTVLRNMKAEKEGKKLRGNSHLHRALGKSPVISSKKRKMMYDSGMMMAGGMMQAGHDGVSHCFCGVCGQVKMFLEGSMNSASISPDKCSGVDLESAWNEHCKDIFEDQCGGGGGSGGQGGGDYVQGSQDSGSMGDMYGTSGGMYGDSSGSYGTHDSSSGNMYDSPGGDMYDSYSGGDHYGTGGTGMDYGTAGTGMDYGTAGTDMDYGTAGSSYGTSGGNSYDTGTYDDATTDTSSYGTTGGNSYGTTGGNSYGTTGGNSYGTTGGNSYGTAGGNSYGTTGGNSYGTTGGNSYGTTGSSSYDNSIYPRQLSKKRVGHKKLPILKKYPMSRNFNVEFRRLSRKYAKEAAEKQATTSVSADGVVAVTTTPTFSREFQHRVNHLALKYEILLVQETVDTHGAQAEEVWQVGEDDEEEANIAEQDGREETGFACDEAEFGQGHESNWQILGVREDARTQRACTAVD